MRIALRCAVWVVCVGFAVSAGVAQARHAAGGKSILEKIEWTWAAQPDAVDAALPNVLLVGDSITRGYYPEVAKLLAGRANCYLFATSAASGDPRLDAQVRDYFRMMPLHFAVIHFNNGMHGWKYTEAEYAEGLPGLVETLRTNGRGAKLVWATTTPVHASDAGGATNARIDVRNADALAVMKRFRVQVDDQHGLMLGHDDLHNGNVHYTPAGYEVQAEQAVKVIEGLLPGR
ncbi:hypothetical protein GCM10011507_13400 [Edaphobacter acidisoli]|uniref:SGNH hydrolase-type esterase domain-containing protein n=1 Tax=Edaphobacter acidisoli TaxID=2040573 RepID=A0A916RMT0_9BACT|nr:SGNH/GDSL hydrolase family protein [Edaphobacter acidisoli]GGA63090.1 hypothetical protein GCM10011507_13400 [Edaphobacter acidisoli]